MTLLREIQDAAIDESIDLITLLRKCKVLAARLGNESFKQWVDWELDGYPSHDNLPEYRIARVQSYGNFSGPFGAAINGVGLPILNVPEEYRESVSWVKVNTPIGGIISTVENSKEPSEGLREPWNPDLIAFTQNKFFEGYGLMAAWKSFPVSYFKSIIDTVRNKILTFVLEVESEAPDAGEAPVNKPSLPDERVQTIVNNHIYGNVGNVATANSNVNQMATIKVQQGDLSSLMSFLENQGLTKEDITSLKEAIEQDPAKPTEQEFGQNVNGWFGRISAKIASGATTIGLGVTTNIIFEAIKAYYGL